MKINEYKTKDIGEAAALYASEIKLLRLDQEIDFYWFIFEDKNTIALADMYWSGTLMVDAQEYNICFKSLKDRIFARQNERGRNG
ncbi:MAG: hypothetical protein ACD_19C00426G0140 [uncultured bacterium]|nr:MAG: hypothetical protein ACD_19C00426G0140 [uncultured bacterium]